MSKTVLKLENVTKAFEDRVAVNNVSFEIHEGEIFGFLGPNGAGKTTTMRMICGLTKPTHGKITICGYDVQHNFEKAMQLTGGIIENPLMYGYMTGYDNLKYYASLYKGITKETIYAYAKIVGLEHRLKDKVKFYSLGMRQRLGIAQALLHNPKLLILDEPFSGLDPQGVVEMRKFLKNLAQKYKIAIMASSHMLAEMEQLCDTLAVINAGQLIELKSIHQLKQNIIGSRKIKFKVDYPNFAGKVIINEFHFPVDVAGNSIYVSAGEDQVPEISKRLLDNGLSIFGVEFISKSLEEIFMELMKRKNRGHIEIF